MAQAVHHYEARVEGMGSSVHEKLLFQDLRDRDDGSEIWLDPSEGSVVWKTVLTVNRFQFESILQRLELVLLAFDEVGVPHAPATNAPRRRQMADMPLYIDTGDPIRDNQRYDAYKAAWIAAHPEQYEELTAPRSTNETAPPE